LKTADVADEKLARQTKLGVVWALGQIGPDARVAIPALTALAGQGADEDLRDLAVESLKKIEGRK
jgi:hypothetical protein